MRCCIPRRQPPPPPLPTTQVIGEFFGLPRQDWEYLQKLAERITSSQDPGLAGPGYGDDAGGAEMASYAAGLTADRRRGDPTEDLTSAILSADFGGRPMSDSPVPLGGPNCAVQTPGG